MRDVALRVLPQQLAAWIFRRARKAAARLESTARFGGIDWARTRAFSEEVNTQPGVWINAARLQRACYIADYCLLVLRDRDGEGAGWVQIHLDEGYPQVTNYSVSVEKLVDEAIYLSNLVNQGNFVMGLLGDVSSASIRAYMRTYRETNNG